MELARYHQLIVHVPPAEPVRSQALLLRIYPAKVGSALESGDRSPGLNLPHRLPRAVWP